jgi:hypothetical protein
MFDLNGEDFKTQSNLIFNNGEAGKVENVSISVEKKTPEMPDLAPDYKVIFTDTAGGQVNMGIYYPKPNEMYDDAKNASLAKLNVGRVLSIAKSVLGNDYVFPAVNNPQEAVDVLMKLTAQNCEGKKVNIFVTYGSVSKPKSYLGVYRNFDFIEAFGTTPSRLRVVRKGNQYDDQMERITEDAPIAGTSASETPVTKQSWI